MKHYLIVGSGLIGRLLAWRLCRAGHYVDILSSDDQLGTGSAGYIAAAMVAPATEAVTSEAMVHTIGQKSLQLWPQWLAELAEPVFYQNNGTLVVAHAGDASEMTRFTRRAEHVLSKQDYAVIDKAGLVEREPQLAEQFEQAILFEHEACLDNRHLYRLLANELATEQCRWQQCDEIESLTQHAIEENCQRYFDHSPERYDAVIDCRGNGARQDIDDLRSVRGEVIRVHAPDVHFKHAIRLMHPRYPMYLAPRPNNDYILGATVIESDDMSPVSVRSGLELMSALYSINKGFAEARIIEMATHCRPSLFNHMPRINRTEWGFRMNGFYRHGYLFAPAIINDMLAVLDGDMTALCFGEYFDV